MKSQELSLPTLTFSPPRFYFFLISAVYMMQLRATAALLGDSLSHNQKKNNGVGGDGGWFSLSLTLCFVLFFFSFFLSPFVRIDPPL